VGDVVTSAQAATALVRAGQRVQVCAGPGVRSEVERRGATVVDREGPADVVIVGFHRTFDYDAMRCAATAVRRGARLIGTNDDATYPTPDGPIPGGGAILASVATGAGVSPVVAGKPYPPMADLVREMLGQLPSGTIMIGDRPDTDGRFARTLGCRFGLVHTGVVRPGETIDPAPEVEAADLATLADVLLAAG
jgi:4-nitrophenyl phosphatase